MVFIKRFLRIVKIKLQGLIYKMDKNIEKEIVNIIAKIKGINEEEIYQNYTQALTGKLFKLDAIDMTYFALEIMKKFNLRFEKKDFDDYKFNFISNVVNIVKDKILF